MSDFKNFILAYGCDCCNTKHSLLDSSQESTSEEFIKSRRRHNRWVNQVKLVGIYGQVIRPYSPCRNQEIMVTVTTIGSQSSQAPSDYSMSKVEFGG